MNKNLYSARIMPLITAAAILVGMLSGCAPGKGNDEYVPLVTASSDAPTLVIDVNSRDHEIIHGSAGFLYGISNEGVPDVNTLTPLKPKVLATKGALGTEHPYGDALDVAEEFFLAGGEQVQMYCSNYYGVFGVTAKAHDYGVVLKNIIAPAVAEWKDGMREKYPDIDGRIVYIPINEGTPVNGVPDFNDAWKIYYDSIKASDPTASIAGPNDSYYRGHDGMVSFLEFCAENDCMPDVVTWHELASNSISTMGEHIADYRSICSELGVGEKQVVINEYAEFCDCGVPGRLVNWIARLEENKVYGCLPFWHQANNLNDLAADSNQGNGAWWVYKWYGDMSGDTLNLTAMNTAKEGFYGIASIDDGKKSISVLCGGADGETAVRLEGFDKSESFANADRVHVTAEATYFTGYHGAQYEPDTVLDGVFPVVDGKVDIVLTDAVFSTAYRLTITNTDEDISVPSVGSFRAVYEAEDAVFCGSLIVDGQDNPVEYPPYYCSGGERVGGIDEDGDGIVYNIEVPADGLYRLEFIYGNGVGSTRNNSVTHNPKNITQSLVIDGEESELFLPNTLFYSMEGDAVHYADLTAGRHTVAVMYSGDEGGFHDALYVSYAGAYAEDAPAYNRLFEAENADFNSYGGISTVIVDNSGNGFTGSGYVTGLSSSHVDQGGGIRFVVDVENSGLYHLGFRYLSESGCKIRVFLDNTNRSFDSLLTEISLAPSDGWADAWTTVFLRRGINIIDLDADTDVALDSMRVIESGLDRSQTIEAETAGGSFSTAESGDTVYVAEMNVSGEYLELSCNADAAGLYKLTIFHSNNDLCGTHTYNIKIVDRDAVIEVNGESAGHYFFPNTFSDDTFLEKTVDIMLKEGENTIRIYNDNRRHVLWGGSQSTPGSNVLENFTSNFDRFVITPAVVEVVPEEVKYSINTLSTSAGFVTASKNCAGAGENVALKLYPQGSIKKLLVNGEDITAKLKTDDCSVYTTEITVNEDTDVFAVFEPAEEIRITSAGTDENATIVCDGKGYKPVSGNLFINGDFSDNSGESMEQWYVGMNEGGHPESGTALRPGFDENGEPVNMVPLSKSGMLVKGEYANSAAGNRFYFGEDTSQPESTRHYLSETIEEPWTSNAWNGAHSLLSYVKIKPDTSYYFSFRARTMGGSASVRYGAVNMKNYVPIVYRTDASIKFSGNGYVSCKNGDMQNLSGSWKQYKTVINSADGDYFIFNAYWLQMCSNLCLGDFRLFEVEETESRMVKIIAADNPDAEIIESGGNIALPERVSAHTSEGEEISLEVKWADEAYELDTQKPGVYSVEGKVLLPDGYYADETLSVHLRLVVGEGL